MPKTKTTKTKYKYEYKDLEKATDWVNFYEQKLLALEGEIDKATTKTEEENIWEEIKLTKQELNRWRGKYDTIESYLEHKASDANAKLRERWGK